METARKMFFVNSGIGPWSSNWTDAATFTTEGPPPDEAPPQVRIRVKGQTLTATWKEIKPIPGDHFTPSYFVSIDTFRLYI